MKKLSKALIFPNTHLCEMCYLSLSNPRLPSLWPTILPCVGSFPKPSVIPFCLCSMLLLPLLSRAHEQHSLKLSFSWLGMCFLGLLMQAGRRSLCEQAAGMASQLSLLSWVHPSCSLLSKSLPADSFGFAGLLAFLLFSTPGSHHTTMLHSVLCSCFSFDSFCRSRTKSEPGNWLWIWGCGHWKNPRERERNHNFSVRTLLGP